MISIFIILKSISVRSAKTVQMFHRWWIYGHSYIRWKIISFRKNTLRFNFSYIKEKQLLYVFVNIYCYKMAVIQNRLHWMWTMDGSQMVSYEIFKDSTWSDQANCLSNCSPTLTNLSQKILLKHKLLPTNQILSLFKFLSTVFSITRYYLALL